MPKKKPAKRPTPPAPAVPHVRSFSPEDDTVKRSAELDRQRWIDSRARVYAKQCAEKRWGAAIYNGVRPEHPRAMLMLNIDFERKKRLNQMAEQFGCSVVALVEEGMDMVLEQKQAKLNQDFQKG